MDNLDLTLPSFLDNKKENSKPINFNKRKRLVKVLNFLGFLCFLVGFGFLFFLVTPVIKFKLNNLLSLFSFDKNKEVQEKSDFEVVSLATPIVTPDPATLPFSIEIPKIAVNEKVIANVDAKDEEAYNKALEMGVAHGLNSAFPGQNKMIFIFGHSSNYEWNVGVYDEIFYQIKDLVSGDEVILHHGTKDYYYEMVEQVIKEKNETDYINNMAKDDVLILQTCYPPGTDWKRLYVVAKPLRVEENGKSGFELLL